MPSAWIAQALHIEVILVEQDHAERVPPAVGEVNRRGTHGVVEFQTFERDRGDVHSDVANEC